jgi:hypothetical protein
MPLPEVKERPGIVKRAEFNALLAFLRPFQKITGGGIVRVTISEENIIIDDGSGASDEAESSSGTGGGSPPAGYSEREVILCDSGDPETVTILVKNAVS